MKRCVALCGVGLLAVLTMVAWSQEGGRGRRAGPGEFGPRGFGPPGFGGGGPGGMQRTRLALLGMPEVREELAIAERQQKPLDDLLDDAQQQMRASFESIDFRELPDLSEEEREQRFAEVRKKSEEIGRKADDALEKILERRQLDRLNQLQVQRVGVEALRRPDVARRLELTDDQNAKIDDVEEGLPPFASPEQSEKALAEALAVLTAAQRSKWDELRGAAFAFPAQRGGGFGPGGRGGPGGPMGQPERKLVRQFDKDEDGWLNLGERNAARESLKTDSGRGGPGRAGPGGPGAAGGRRGGFGPPGGMGGRRGREAPQPGARVAPEQVAAIPDAPFYEPDVLRTLFFEFESPEWETELADFHNTDVEVPATLIVDGKKYPNVGVHFRGMSSYGMIPAGFKRSLNVAVDFVDTKQRLYGYKTLNLINAHEDATFMSTVLYSHVARKYIPAPKANFVKVVINGESWGVYVNVQQFNKEFLAENFQPAKGTRWKVRGSPGGGGGLEYFGDKLDDYKRRYEIKSDDDEKAWNALIALCKTLHETPADRLEAALEPIVDVDGLLWFLALDVSLINCDGYWIRASDYSIFRDAKGKFHFIPHDMNEAFRPAGGPGFGPPGGFGGRPEGRPGAGGPGGGGPGVGRAALELDPLVGLDDSRKPLRSKILAVSALRQRYLQHVRTIAEESLDWMNLGPVVARFRHLIEKEVDADTRKLESFEEFEKLTADSAAAASPGQRSVPLRTFADQRRAYLLKATTSATASAVSK